MKGQRKKDSATKDNDTFDQEYIEFNEKLKPLGLFLHQVESDGNCLFRAVADQVTNNENRHEEFRIRGVTYMKEHPLDFTPFITDKSFEEYCESMMEDGRWGGYPELVALSHSEKLNIIVHQLDAPKFEIISPSANCTIHLSYHMGEHYNSVREINKQVLDIHNSHTFFQSQLQNNVQIVLQNVLSLWMQQVSHTDASFIKKYDDKYVTSLLLQLNNDVDTAVNYILAEASLNNQENVTLLSQVREYFESDLISNEAIMKALKENDFNIDNTVTQLFNLLGYSTGNSTLEHELSTEDNDEFKAKKESVTQVTRKPKKVTNKKLTKREKKELKRQEKMKKRAKGLASDKDSEKSNSDEEESEIDREELKKLDSQTSSVII